MATSHRPASAGWTPVIPVKPPPAIPPTNTSGLSTGIDEDFWRGAVQRNPAVGGPASRSTASGRRPAPAPASTGRRLTRTFEQLRIGSWRHPARLGGGSRRGTRLLFARHRRPLAVAATLIGLWVTVRSAIPDPPPTKRVLVAAHDLAAGHTLSGSDLETAIWPARSTPPAPLTRAAGRVLAAPIRAGEPLTDARVIGAGLLTGQTANLVAAPVRLSDPAAAGLVAAGDHVDVLVTRSTWSSTAGVSVGPDDDGADGAGSAEGAGAESITGAGTSGAVDAERVTGAALVLAAPGPGSSALGQSPESATGGLGGLTGGSLTGTDDQGGGLSGVLVLAVRPDQARRLAAAQASGQVSIDVVSPS
jgi:hypothetical protein